jgi:hypothetical protein
VSVIVSHVIVWGTWSPSSAACSVPICGSGVWSRGDWQTVSSVEPLIVISHTSVIQDSATRTTKNEDHVNLLEIYITAMKCLGIDTCNARA